MWARSKGAPLFRFLAMIYFPSNFPLVLTKTREYWWLMLLCVFVGSLYVYDYHWSTALLLFYWMPLSVVLETNVQSSLEEEQFTSNRFIVMWRYVLIKHCHVVKNLRMTMHYWTIWCLRKMMNSFYVSLSLSRRWLNAFKAVERPLGPRVPCSIAGTKPWLRSWPRQKYLHERFQCCRPKSLI